MNNNKLIHYLNSGVETNYGKLLGIKNGNPIIADKQWNGIPIEFKNVKDFVYYLYPLDLTKPIIHNGVEEIPLVELAKIEGCYTNEDYEILVNKRGKWVRLDFEDGECVLNHFCYYPKLHSFSLTHEWNDWHERIVKDQLILFDYLYSRRINIWGIDAIDPNELGDNNPYLITDK